MLPYPSWVSRRKHIIEQRNEHRGGARAMSDNTEEQITQNVLNSMAQTPNPRLKTVMTSLIRHLHAFVREVELTEEEWMTGIQFLTRTGQMCDDKRQEFILLSDTLGVS